MEVGRVWLATVGGVLLDRKCTGGGVRRAGGHKLETISSNRAKFRMITSAHTQI